jgi:DNA-binding transcriptional ArsR family regulator
MSVEVDDELWSAIADPSRRRVLDLIVVGGEATPSTLAGAVPFSRQAVSKHLAVLEQAGLVESRRAGREVRYRVAPARLDEAARAMANVASDWDRRLRAIKRIAEAAHARSKQAKHTKQ